MYLIQNICQIQKSFNKPRKKNHYLLTKRGELLITIVFIILPTFDGILNRLRSGKRLKRGRWEQLLMWYINNVTLHRSPSSNIKFFD
jgi:hypothetical protein